MNTGDANYIKQINRRILIEEIIKNISISRSDLARITGLNKATVSAQVNDLIQDRIIIEKNGESESITRGRKPILLEIDGKAGYSIGIDIDEPLTNILFVDLKGKPIHRLTLEVENSPLEQLIHFLVQHLTPQIERLNQIYQPIGLVGISVGIHGIVSNQQEIVFTPKQQWTHIDLQHRLEEIWKTPVYVDNNANLSAFAEQVYEENISDLFCISLYSGVGLGMIHQNQIYRGYQGFAGEIGHMIVEPDGLSCSCGNRGCWELYASEKSLLQRLQKADPSVTHPVDITTLRDHEAFEGILDEYFGYLAVGLNNIINIFNPEKIILNGTIINEYESTITKIHQKLQSRMNHYREIRTSRLGKDACALGGAALMLKRFFHVDTIDFVNYQYNPRCLQSG